ncbi:MAG: hypothetical protein IJ654_10520 [Bacteroidales bacterium]|nr:hypothetical protein [Bacteroidales bacterium]
MFKSIRHHVRHLSAGSSLTIPAGEITGNALRNYASAASSDFEGRRYSVHYDRNARTYTVTRHA